MHFPQGRNGTLSRQKRGENECVVVVVLGLLQAFGFGFRLRLKVKVTLQTASYLPRVKLPYFDKAFSRDGAKW
jgi:hypothetical protein